MPQLDQNSLSPKVSLIIVGYIYFIAAEKRKPYEHD